MASKLLMLHRLWPRRTLPVLVAAISLAVILLVIFRPAFTEFLELKLQDLKFRYRGARPAGNEVVILAIDDDSLKKVGRWPWSREVMAKLLGRLKEAGPRVIALDIIFAEREETAKVSAIRSLRRELQQLGRASPEVLQYLRAAEEEADVDRRLAQVIGQGPPTILGFFFREVGGVSIPLSPAQSLQPSVIQVSTYNMVRWLDKQPSRLPFMRAGGVELNLPEITLAAAGNGYFNMVPDLDGTVRWLPLVIHYGQDMFAPLTLVTVQHYMGNPPLGLTLSRLGVDQIRLGQRHIPVDWLGRLLINYLGPPGLFPMYSAADLLEGRLNPQLLQDKIVLVGATAVGIYDLRVTPFSGTCPGVEIQATIIDNILRTDFLVAPLPFHLPALVSVLLLGLILGLILPRLSGPGAFVFTLLLTQGYVVLNYLLFSFQGWQVELFYPLLEIASVYTGVTVQRILAEERERARLKKAFQSYVAPEVVNQIIKHPERLRLGGERRELTVLFCDIRGFTTLSETLEPEVLVEVLHEFLNPMSEIIVKHGGTLDKYLGDAIMALFGAPLILPDHASRACRAALEMTTALRTLDQEWSRQGRQPLRIGVGLNSGVVAVGNMGSDRLFDYTAIGDNVNLASRLEGLNKYYHTEIIISGGVARLLDGAFILKELDLVQVKGKKEPVPIFELLGEGEPDPELAQFLSLYHEGLTLFRARKWPESTRAFQAALTLRPQDEQIRTYLDLIQRFQVVPPPPDWQGVTVMEQK